MKRKARFPQPEMTYKSACPCNQEWLLLTSTCRWTQIAESVVPVIWNGKYIHQCYTSIIYLHVVKLWAYLSI